MDGSRGSLCVPLGAPFIWGATLRRWFARGMAAAVFAAVALGQTLPIVDPQLQAAIAETLSASTDELTPQKLLELTELTAPRREITSLEGLENAHNLVSLDLGYNQLGPSIIFPAGLHQLQKLVLRGNNLARVDLPEDLQQLLRLDLSENPLTSTSFLTNALGLLVLELEADSLDALDLPPKMTQLAKLNLVSNRLTNFGCLEHCDQLETLFLDDNGLKSVSLPPSLSTLTTLTLGINRLTNFSFLEPLTNLFYLDLSANRLTDLTLPESLSALSGFNLSENRLTRLNLPETMTNLSVLQLFDNQLSEVSGLPNTSKLSLLDLELNQLQELVLPRSCTNLTVLWLSDNPLSALAFPETLSTTTLSNTFSTLASAGVGLYPYPLFPRLTELRLAPPSGISWVLHGPPGLYTVQESEDLRDWSAAGSVSNHLGVAQYSTTGGLTKRSSFMRVVVE